MSRAFDSSEMRAFSTDIARAATGIPEKVRAVVKHGAVNIKATMQIDMDASPHFKRVSDDISFDMIEGDDEVAAEVGPVVGRGKKHAGGLAHIAYFGAPDGGGGSVRDPKAALDEEEPRMVAALADLFGKAP